MGAKKKYIEVRLHPLLLNIVTKDGALKSFSFMGGFTHPIFKPGSYSTRDEEEQKLLESHPWFGVEFVLESVTKVVEEPEGNNGNDNNGTEEMTFKTVNLAKDYFHKEHGIAKSKLDVKAKVIAEGKQLNIDVKFESDNQ